MSQTATLASALHRYRDARHAAMELARTRAGLGVLDTRVVVFIAENPGTRPSDVRAELDVSSASVTTIVERLVDRGIVRREADELDRRAIRLLIDVDATVSPWRELNTFDAILADHADPEAAATVARLLNEITDSALAAIFARDNPTPGR